MGVELPLLQIYINRLDEPTIHLAAYGSIAFAIALVIEGPIIQLLAASTALCGDRDSFLKVRRFMMHAAAWLTLAHIAIAFTPIYDWIAGSLLKVPDEIFEAGRLGLQWLTPWTAAIAYRRFHQGVLIRFERSRVVGVGTVIRLVALLAVLQIGSYGVLATWWEIPGVVIGAAAVSAGVIAEAAFIGWIVRPTVRKHLGKDTTAEPPLTRLAFRRFYLPLALTPLLTLIIQPTGSATMSRMPDELNSLAAWPVVHSMVFLLRSAGFAYNEVVVSLLGKPNAEAVLRRFAFLLAGITSLILLLLGATPLADFWFGKISNLPPELNPYVRTGILIAIAMPAYQALQSWYSGVLVHKRATRGITEAVALYVLIALVGLWSGVKWSSLPGLYFAVAVFVCGGIAQTCWLAWRARPHFAATREKSAQA